MRALRSAVIAGLLGLSFLIPNQRCMAQAAAGATVNADRWMEIDFYWFRQQDIQGSVKEFWDRFEPLYTGVKGYRGIVLNIGWTVGPIMEWSGNLDQRISLPTGSGQAKWVDESKPLTGTTEERKKQAETRFAQALLSTRHGYDPWTWRDVKHLSAALKAEAARRGISDLKVGMLNFAWPDAYGEIAPWVEKHPEAFSQARGGQGDVWPRYFDPETRLHADHAPLGGLPHGIAEGTPVPKAYAAQWGSLSRAVGLDAIMLRDSFGMPVPYRRDGPWGPLAPSAEEIRKATDAVAELVKDTKLANPEALVMMYSNAASAVADWRSNGMDLEAIAKQGYLDIWVDQTWPGAWNEVGVREHDFWNNPTLGWTYQLAYTLMHAAALADTKVRHYPLVETFDAWEDWDVIHSVPEKLRWGIWAYSHATVKTPAGLKVPAGTYISWANQGKQLLSEADVRYLTGNINAAVADAKQVKEVSGATLVYSREAMQWQADHATPDHDINEWLDEAMAAAAKWPVPMLSITRLEWLPKVSSDLFVAGTPSHLSEANLTALAETIKKGQPVALVGSFANGIDASLLKLAGLGEITPAGQGPNQLCKAVNEAPELVKNAPKEFDTTCRPEGGAKVAGAKTIYTQGGAAALTLDLSGGKKAVLWNAPDLRKLGGKPLKDMWGNTGAPYALAAGALTDLLRQNARLHASEIDLNQTMSVAAWQTRDGVTHILAGNLEEGLRDDADLSRHATLTLPKTWQQPWKDVWTGKAFAVKDGAVTIDLPQAASVLLETAK